MKGTVGKREELFSLTSHQGVREDRILREKNKRSTGIRQSAGKDLRNTGTGLECEHFVLYGGVNLTVGWGYS